MRDAIGGTMTLVIVVVFIVIALGYMAFNVNYTKAFRMKDKIISVYEKYNGYCNSNCKKEIEAYAKELAYSAGNKVVCPQGATLVKKLYCVKEVNATSIADGKPKRYFNIVTKINIEIPIINNVLNFQFFYIKGDTKTFTK